MAEAQVFFRFEEAWLIRDDCVKVINDSWSSAGTTKSGLKHMKEKIGSCGTELQAWGASNTHPNVEEIKKVQKWVKELSMVDPTVENKSEFLAASKILNDLLLK